MTLALHKNYLPPIPHEIPSYIYSMAKDDAPTKYRKIESNNADLLITIARIFNAGPHWILNRNTGPLKELNQKLKDEIIEKLKSLPKEVLNWPRYLKIVNEAIMQRSKAYEPWFEYLELVESEVDECPYHADPNVLNDDGNSPYSLAHLRYSLNKHSYSFLIPKFDQANVSQPTRALALVDLFKDSSSSLIESLYFPQLLNQADTITPKLNMDVKENLLKNYFKNHFLTILNQMGSSVCREFTLWLKNIGAKYTLEALCDLLTAHANKSQHIRYNKNDLETFEKLIRKLYQETDIPLDTQLESGDHLIHSILKNRDLEIPLKTDLLKLILSKFPKEINACDRQQKGILSILFDHGNNEIWECLKGYIDSDLLTNLREECHSHIKEDLPSCFHYIPWHKDIYIESFKKYFQNLKALLPSDGSFENWLFKADDKSSLLHEIAYWRPSVIEKLLKEKVISEEICMRKDPASPHGHTVLEICKHQSKLFEALYQWYESKDKIALDSALYAYFNEKVKKTRTPFIFEVFLSTAVNSERLYSSAFRQLVRLEPNITNEFGDTLLHKFLGSNFCTQNNISILENLIEDGVDPQIKTNNGENSLDYARKYNRTFAPYLS